MSSDSKQYAFFSPTQAKFSKSVNVYRLTCGSNFQVTEVSSNPKLDKTYYHKDMIYLGVVEEWIRKIN